MHGGLYRAYFIDNIAVSDVKEMLMIVAALDLGVGRAQPYELLEQLI